MRVDSDEWNWIFPLQNSRLLVIRVGVTVSDWMKVDTGQRNGLIQCYRCRRAKRSWPRSRPVSAKCSCITWRSGRSCASGKWRTWILATLHGHLLLIRLANDLSRCDPGRVSSLVALSFQCLALFAFCFCSSLHSLVIAIDCSANGPPWCNAICGAISLETC